jgi:cell division protein FtsL
MIDTKTQILHLASEIKSCNQVIARQKESIGVLKANIERLLETLTPDEKKYIMRQWGKMNADR